MSVYMPKYGMSDAYFVFYALFIVLFITSKLSATAKYRLHFFKISVKKRRMRKKLCKNK